MIRSSLCWFCALPVLITAVGTAQAGDPYLGNKIVPKFEHVSVQVDSQEVGTELDFNWPVKVERVNGQWLWITDDGSFSVSGRRTEGWVSKHDVILLDNDPIENKTSAFDYLTQCLVRDRNAGWAYWLRGVIWKVKSNWRMARLDLEEATKAAPWLDNAWESLAFCEYHEALDEYMPTFAKVSSGEQRSLQPDELPDLLRTAVKHFKTAASLCPRPWTFCEWGEALSIRYWNNFDRQTWIYFLEDPESYSGPCPNCAKAYITYRAGLEPFSDEGTWSAPCLIQHAIDLCPQFSDAIYDRGVLYEYAADYQIGKMCDQWDWQLRTRDKFISCLTGKIQRAQDQLARLTSTAQSDVHELDLEAAKKETPFGKWRIDKLSKKCKNDYDAIDVQQAKIGILKQLKELLAGIAAPQTAIDELQMETIKRIKPLTDRCLQDFNAVLAADPQSITAARDLAAIYLMEINPTGRHPIQKTKKFDPTQFASIAQHWAAQSASEAEFKDDTANVVVLPTWAAALYATGSYDEAIRRESADWSLMDDAQKATARDFIDRCKAAKAALPAEPK